MRCLALAEAWQAGGGEVVFLTHCESPLLAGRIADAVLRVERIDTPHPAPVDLDRTLSVVGQYARGQASPPWVILDGYHFDERYQRALRHAGARVLVIDDYAHLPRYDADVLLNQNLGAEDLSYQSNTGTVRLLGPRYALLRSEFGQWRGHVRQFPDLARKVLITGGASASGSFLHSALESVRQTGVEDLHVALVVGPTSSAGAAFPVDGWRRAGLEIDLVENPADLSRWMSWADVAIAAAGGTAWELAFMGVPAVLVAIAENQRPAVRALTACGGAAFGGEAPDVSWTVVADALARLMRDGDARRRMSATAQSLVDGYGPERVTAILAGA